MGKRARLLELKIDGTSSFGPKYKSEKVEGNKVKMLSVVSETCLSVRKNYEVWRRDIVLHSLS